MSNVIVTSAGLAALVNAEKTGTLPVKITKFGLGSGNYEPTPAATALQSQFKELNALSGGPVGDNTIHVTMSDDSTDAYTVNEVGAFLEDGTLFAVASQPVGAILQKAAGSQGLLSLDVVLEGGADKVAVVGDTNFFNPPATRETKGVVKLATNAEAEEGLDDTKAVTPLTLWLAIKKAINAFKKEVVTMISAAGLALIPIGTVIHYLGTDIPDGYLLCNGAEFSAQDFPELARVLGKNVLPDTHHRVLEGTTILSEVGTYQEAGLPNSTGTFEVWSGKQGYLSTSGNGVFKSENNGVNPIVLNSGTFTYGEKSNDRVTFDTSRVNSIYQGGLNTVNVEALKGLALVRSY